MGRRWTRDLSGLVVLCVLWSLLAALPAAAASGCLTDDTDDVTAGLDGPVVDRPRSDVIEWCVDYDAENLTLAVEVSEPTDPLFDSTWDDFGAAIVMFFEDAQGRSRTLQMAKGSSDESFEHFVFETDGAIACQGPASFVDATYTATVSEECLVAPGEVSVQVAAFYGRDSSGTFEQSARDYAPDLGFVTVPQSEVAGSETVTRLAGPERVATAIEISRASFADGQADEVIVASSEAFPDAVVAAPLAVTVNGPVLLTPSAALPAMVLEEITRAAGAGAPVRIMGGTLAVSAAVEQALVDAGHAVTRVAGRNRFETSVAAAEAANSDPQNILLAYGGEFGAALVSGAAAPLLAATVVLIDAGGIPEAVQQYLDSHPDAKKFPVGAAAIEAAPPLDGAVLGDTAAAVSVAMAEIYPDTDAVALASAERFPDGLAGGAYAARRRIPLLLSARDFVQTSVLEFLRSEGPWQQITFFGGTAALSDTVAGQAASTWGG